MESSGFPSYAASRDTTCLAQRSFDLSGFGRHLIRLRTTRDSLIYARSSATLVLASSDEQMMRLLNPFPRGHLSQESGRTQPTPASITPTSVLHRTRYAVGILDWGCTPALESANIRSMSCHNCCTTRPLPSFYPSGIPLQAKCNRIPQKSQSFSFRPLTTDRKRTLTDRGELITGFQVESYR